MPAPLDFSRIDLRRAERGYVCGDSRTGKSELSELLGTAWTGRYSGGKFPGKRLILDTKPHFAPEWHTSGWSTKRTYSGVELKHLPGAVLIGSAGDLTDALRWSHTVVAQGESEEDLPRIMDIVWAFYAGAKARQPRLLQVDEGHDWYSVNGQPKVRRDGIAKAQRAGGERGLGVLFASQRTKGIPVSMLGFANKAYLFATSWTDDLKQLTQAGMPPDLENVVPTEDYWFAYWSRAKRRQMWGPYRIDL